MASEGGPCGDGGRAAHAQHGSPGAHRPGSRADPPRAGPGGRPPAARGGGRVLRTARRRDQAKRPRPIGPGRQGAPSKRAAAGARGARAAMAMRKPSPSAPSRAPAGTRTASSCTAAVGCAHQPSLASGRPTLRPGAPWRGAAPPQARGPPRRAQTGLPREPRARGEVARAGLPRPSGGPAPPPAEGAPRGTRRLKASVHPETVSPCAPSRPAGWRSQGDACALLARQRAVHMQGMLCRVSGTGDAAAPPGTIGRPGRGGRRLLDYEGGDAARPGRARARHDQVQVSRARAADEGLGACAARARGGARSAPTAGPRATGRGAVPAGMLAVDCPVAPAAAAMTSSAPHARCPAASLGAEAGDIGRGRSKWSRSPSHRLEHPGSTCPTGTPPPRQSSARERA